VGVKAKAVPLYATNALGREEVYLVLILDLGTRWGEWSASRLGRAVAPRKGPPVTIVQEGGWALEPVWTQRLQEKSFHLCQGSNLDCPVVQSVARHYSDWANRLIFMAVEVIISVCCFALPFPVAPDAVGCQFRNTASCSS
jgi:hypothetical protein